MTATIHDRANRVAEQEPIAAAPQMPVVEETRLPALLPSGGARRLSAFCRALASWSVVSLDWPLGKRLREAFGILMYHRIAPHFAGQPTPTYNVTPDRFRAQLAGLLERGFQAWPLRRVLRYHTTGERIPRNVFVVTFDDGYACLHRHAWPILQELRVPATIFLATAHLDSKEPLPFDIWAAAGSPAVDADAWQALTTQQCEEMRADGLIELGCHTHTHRDFRGHTDALAQDLARSLAVLRARFDISDPTFALPFGILDAAMLEIVRAAGMCCCLTTDRQLVEPTCDPFEWGRFGVEQSDCAATLAAKLNGWYSLVQNTWRWLAALRGGRAPAGQGRANPQSHHRVSHCAKNASPN